MTLLLEKLTNRLNINQVELQEFSHSLDINGKFDPYKFDEDDIINTEDNLNDFMTIDDRAKNLLSLVYFGEFVANIWFL